MQEDNETLRYPIGRYQRPKKCTSELQQEWITAIDALPRWLSLCIENFTENEFQMSYRKDGWTVQQLIHHLADVHAMAYMRLKLALTRDDPVINPYDENVWAELPDVAIVPVNFSVSLLQGVHRRWAETLLNMKRSDWTRTFYHPEQKKNIRLWEMISLYAWHGSHHVAQIRHLYYSGNKSGLLVLHSE